MGCYWPHSQVTAPQCPVLGVGPGVLVTSGGFWDHFVPLGVQEAAAALFVGTGHEAPSAVAGKATPGRAREQALPPAGGPSEPQLPHYEMASVILASPGLRGPNGTDQPFLGARFPVGREEYSIASPEMGKAQVTLDGGTRPTRAHGGGVHTCPVGGGVSWGSREPGVGGAVRVGGQVGMRSPFWTWVGL